MTMIKEQFHDVMRRTMRKLAIIERASSESGEAFELTQLMNSFQGARHQRSMLSSQSSF